MIDLDAAVVICHPDKEQTAPTFKHTFGYHPMVAFLDNTGEALDPEHPAVRKPGNQPRPHEKYDRTKITYTIKDLLKVLVNHQD